MPTVLPKSSGNTQNIYQLAQHVLKPVKEVVLAGSESCAAEP